MTTIETERRHLIALRPAALFDGIRSTLLADPMVLVDRGRIVAVEAGRVEPPQHAAVVDLPGTTLLPGLIDTHVHLAFDAGPDPIATLEASDDDTLLAAMARAARLALQAGVTTVRDLGDRNYLALRLRAEHDASDALPTIVAAGPPITTPGGHCGFLGCTARGADAVRAAVAEHAGHGVDAIKVMASGGFLTPGSAGHLPQYGPGELRVIVDEAHRHGLPVTAHAHSTASIAAALDAGVEGIEHCSFLTPDGADAPADLVSRIARRRVAIGPTLGALPGFEPPPAIARLLDTRWANLGRLHRAGVQILAATDAGIGPMKPHDVLPYAVEHLVQAGLTNHEALRAITLEAARVCGLGDRKGRIAAGFDADLAAVKGDPLTDPAALHRVVAVYHQGYRVSRGRSDR
ncbi:MAG: amidohydrolase family protein [Acidimicrobiales bacterium]